LPAAHSFACLTALIDSLPTTHSIRLGVKYIFLARLAFAFGNPLSFFPAPVAVLRVSAVALRRFLRFCEITDAFAP
jgi:hypothetical protein